MSQTATSPNFPPSKGPSAPLEDLLVVYKPTGIKTHRASDKDWGLVEWLEEKLHNPLFLFQRLDFGTSGLLLIGRSEKTARDWTEKLAKKTLKKTYVFLSHSSNTPPQKKTIQSSISKIKGEWRSQAAPPFNSETDFEHISTWKNFHLFKAYPKTGKSHQIRLHAESMGFPILGDKEHGGTDFFRLALHAESLFDPTINKKWLMKAPPYFYDLPLLEQGELCPLLEAVHQRQELQACGLLPKDSLRLSHREHDFLRIDQLGPQYWIYDYREHATTPLQTIEQWLKIIPADSVKPLWIREMKNRGGAPNEAQLLSLGEPATRWITEENGLQYEMRSDQGLSPGLFLDQRENRAWVLQNAQNKSVLNLFSYTCGFSLCAAKGGAKEVVSVDVSRNFIEWGKHHFSLNGLDPRPYEFWVSDTFEFALRTQKKQRTFDLIICDPPSFGRSKKGVFKIEKDLSRLSKLLFSLLNPKGLLLLSTNFEKWTQDDFYKECTQNLPPRSWESHPASLPGLDFLEGSQPLLKTMIIQKRDAITKV